MVYSNRFAHIYKCRPTFINVAVFVVLAQTVAPSMKGMHCSKWYCVGLPMVCAVQAYKDNYVRTLPMLCIYVAKVGPAGHVHILLNQ